MKNFLFLISLALAVGGQSVRGQSSFSNPIWKPNARIQIPFVQPLETDGTETLERLGDNLTKNGEFLTSGEWTTTGVINISGGRCRITGGASVSGVSQQLDTLVSGNVYRVEFDVVDILGFGHLTISISGILMPTNSFLILNESGHYSADVTASDLKRISLEAPAGTGVDIWVDNLTVRRLETEEVAKLNPLRNLNFSDFVLKAIDHSNPTNPIVYFYSSVKNWNPTSEAKNDTNALVYYSHLGATWPANVARIQHTNTDRETAGLSGTDAGIIEIWPDRVRLAQARISATSRNISWLCLLLNPVDLYRTTEGYAQWFNVEIEWRQFPPKY